jgi:hypothetical protein
MISMRPPRGLFLDVQLAEGFEHEMGFRQSHDVVPVRPTQQFRPESVVYIVFSTHQHYNAFQVFGRCYPEQVAGLDPTTLLVEDAMYIALEDNSGYIQLNPPAGGWRPGATRSSCISAFRSMTSAWSALCGSLSRPRTAWRVREG